MKVATKNKPGKYDCYTNAEPDEPMFVLLARDPVAPALVRLWVAARNGDLRGIMNGAIELRNAGLHPYAGVTTPTGPLKPVSEEKRQEALDCADSMAKWIEQRRGGVR